MISQGYLFKYFLRFFNWLHNAVVSIHTIFIPLHNIFRFVRCVGSFRSFLFSIIYVKMLNNKTSITSNNFSCKSCNFICSKKGDYNRHLSTSKHAKLTKCYTALSEKTSHLFTCPCGCYFKHQSSYSRHKASCRTSEFEHKCSHDDTDFENRETKDDIIDKLYQENREMKDANREIKSMFMLMMEKYEEERIRNETDKKEIMNKIIDIIPKVGNTTNNHTVNNTLNFYLTNTCKDAESIHDFTDRYVKRCVEFFTDKYRDVATNQISLASNVYELFFRCLEENPQYMNFIQTTDIKNGVFYVKEKRKDENRQLYGEAEFIKYVDGFEKAGASIGHAMNKALLPLKNTFTVKLEQEIGRPPNEDDYEDEDEYEEVLNKYKERKQEIGRSLFTHVYDATSLFDSRTRKMEVLEKTKRLKDA